MAALPISISPVFADPPANECGVLSRNRAFAKEVIGNFEQLVELEVDSCKAAKHCVQMRHQQ